MKDIYSMKLHEVISANDTHYIEILRVPGGWIYTVYSVTDTEYLPASTFVPFNNEFNTDV